MDAVDQAETYQEFILAAKIQDCHNHIVDIKGDGFCLSCGNNVEPLLINGVLITGRWCCPECRDAWDKADG